MAPGQHHLDSPPGLNSRTGSAGGQQPVAKSISGICLPLKGASSLKICYSSEATTSKAWSTWKNKGPAHLQGYLCSSVQSCTPHFPTPSSDPKSTPQQISYRHSNRVYSHRTSPGKRAKGKKVLPKHRENWHHGGGHL